MARETNQKEHINRADEPMGQNQGERMCNLLSNGCENKKCEITTTVLNHCGGFASLPRVCSCVLRACGLVPCFTIGVRCLTSLYDVVITSYAYAVRTLNSCRTVA